MSRLSANGLTTTYLRGVIEDKFREVCAAVNGIEEGTIYVRHRPITVATAYQALASDGIILINGDITVTLPTAASVLHKRITCKVINAGAGTRTVSGNGSNIDGAATWTTTTQYASADFVSNGTQWYIV